MAYQKLKITREEFRDSLREYYNSKLNKLQKKYEKVYDALLATADKQITKEELENILRDKERVEYELNEKYSDERVNLIIERSLEAYDIASKMVYTLGEELGAVLADDDTLVFNWQGKTISFITKMIASYFNLHCGTFTFDSSFTTHEAYTPKGHLMHIGVTRDGNSIAIKFNLFDKNKSE